MLGITGGVIISAAFFGALLMTVLTYTWGLGTYANRQVLLTVLMLLAILSITGCAHDDQWTRADTALYVTYVGTLAYDGHTTAEIRHYPCLEEAGDIAKHALGSQPSASGTWQYMGTLAISNYLIARALPSKWRKVWLVGNAYGHGNAAFNNDKLFDKGC